MSADDPKAPAPDGSEFQRDVVIDKPGIVGARWWHQGLLDEDRKVTRRRLLKGVAIAGGLAALGATLVGLVDGVASESESSVSIALREALVMQKTYGWDFGARGVPLVFDGKAEALFVRAELANLAAVMTPAPGKYAKYHVPTLVESLVATPAASLPDPVDGAPRPDGAPFQRLADVIVPIVNPAMHHAYAVGRALAPLASNRQGLAVLVDVPGPQAVALAAGAASAFEPVLLLDNWPHPYGVVPSHLTLAALAYYQPRFAAEKERRAAPPLFVLDRLRLTPYSEESTRFDNRYYARMPNLAALAKDGVGTLLYVVESPSALPEPDDLNPSFTVSTAEGDLKAEADIQLRAVALTDFRNPHGGDGPGAYYEGSPEREASFWTPGPGSAPAEGTAPPATRAYAFSPRAPGRAAPVGLVPVVLSAAGVILAGALDRRGSMNRFSGGYGG